MEFYYEDETNYYYRTGKIVGNFFKSKERRGLCKLCGKDYQLPERHGLVDFKGIYPSHYSSSEVCLECIKRGEAIVFHRDLEIIPICKNCLENHHNLDFYFLKYTLMLCHLYKLRMDWNESH